MKLLLEDVAILYSKAECSSESCSAKDFQLALILTFSCSSFNFMLQK